MKTSVLSIAIGCLFRFTLSAAETAPEAITITAPDGIKILKLESGQPRLYDSKPLRVIEKVAENLAGWQFTSIPQRIVISYQIRVNKTGVIYAFGCGSSRKPPTREQVLGDDASRWVPDADAIEGKNVAVCFRRNVTAGETIALQSFELQLAAESIAVAGTLADASPVAATASGSGAEKTDADPPHRKFSRGRGRTRLNGRWRRWIERFQATSIKTLHCCARICWTKRRKNRQPARPLTNWASNFAMT